MLNIRRIAMATSTRPAVGASSQRVVVREEQLLASKGLKRPGSMSVWRGLSGRRYVVGVHPLCGDVLADMGDSVALAVDRDRDGEARLIGVVSFEVFSCGAAQEVARRWVARMRLRGATEMHVHCLAESESARRAILTDLPAAGLDAPGSSVRRQDI